MTESIFQSETPKSSDVKASFDQKYAEGLRKYNSLGMEISAVFLKPEHPKTEVPVILAPGWSEGAEVYKECVAKLYEAGRPVIALDHPRRGGDVVQNSEYSLDELRKALTIKTIVEEEDIAQFDVVGHSEASIYSSIAASLLPGKLREMVVFNPGGLIGKDTMLQLLGRFARKNIENVVRTLSDKEALSRVMNGLSKGGEYFAQNPVRGLNEIRAISQADIEGTLKNLHDQGVGIIIIHGVDDVGFPMSRMQQIVKSPDHPDGFVDGFLSVEGGHDELYIRPDKYMHVADEMLTALERKQNPSGK